MALPSSIHSLVQTARRGTMLAQVHVVNWAMDMGFPPFGRTTAALHHTPFHHPAPPRPSAACTAAMYPSYAVDMMRRGLAFYTQDDILKGLAASGRTILNTEEQRAIFLAQRHYALNEMRRIERVSQLPDNPFKKGVVEWGRHYRSMGLI